MFLFVSPHLDDVALSCGGWVARLTAAGQAVTIATLCTADAPDDWPLSPAAQHEHRQWQLGDRPYQRRRIEDEQACRVLGAHPVHLGLLDAVYRHDENGAPLYSNNSFIGGDIHPFDRQAYYPHIEAALAPLLSAATQVYAPLAIGEHVDHVLVRLAVEALTPSDRLCYYEDFPYAEADETLKRADYFIARCIALTRHEIETRVRAIACYASQVRVMFGSAEAMSDRLHRYIARVGGERYWSKNWLRDQ